MNSALVIIIVLVVTVHAALTYFTIRYLYYSVKQAKVVEKLGMTERLDEEHRNQLRGK